MIDYLTRRIWLALTLSAAFAMLGAFTTMLLLPSYRATTILLVQRAAGATSDSPAATHAEVALSDSVLRSALRDVPLDPQGGSLIALREDWLPATLARNISTLINGTPNVLDLRNNFSSDVQPSQGIVKLSFRYRDPSDAARLLNTVVQRYGEKISQLGRWQDGTSSQETLDKLLEAYRIASLDLSNFSAKTKLYSADQKDKTANQRSELSAALNQTRQELESRKAQLEVWPEELGKMRPLARILGTTDLMAAPKTGSSVGTTPEAYNSPPLVLQRVYQDSVQQVLKLRAETAGLSKQLEEQERTLAQLDQQLLAFSRNEPELNSLKLRVEQTYADAASFSKWLLQSRTDATLAEAKVLQPAYPVGLSVFPNLKEFVLAGAAFGFMLTVLLTLLSKEGRALIARALADAPESGDPEPETATVAPVQFGVPGREQRKSAWIRRT